MLLAGDSQAQAVVRVVGVGDDSLDHFAILPGAVAKNLPSRGPDGGLMGQRAEGLTPGVESVSKRAGV
jgi:hypothetical protein